MSSKVYMLLDIMDRGLQYAVQILRCKQYKKPAMLSGHRDSSFGRAYGVLIEELRLLSRAIIIIDRNDIVRYAEYVTEVTQHPDYDKAIVALKNIVTQSTKEASAMAS